MPLLNVREIARLVADSPKEEPTVFERLKYWTRERLIIPADGDVHPGSGRPRLYSASAVQKARVLNTLMDFGMTTKTMQTALNYLDTPGLEEVRPEFLIIHRLRSLEGLRKTFDLPPEVIEQALVRKNLLFSVWRKTDDQQVPPINDYADATLIIRL
jgi:hypothetical protein